VVVRWRRRQGKKGGVVLLAGGNRNTSKGEEGGVAGSFFRSVNKIKFPFRNEEATDVSVG